MENGGFGGEFKLGKIFELCGCGRGFNAIISTKFKSFMKSSSGKIRAVIKHSIWGKQNPSKIQANSYSWKSNVTISIISKLVWHSTCDRTRYILKVEFSSDAALRNKFKLFPPNIWILKYRFCSKETTKMITFKFKEVQ